MAASSSTRSRMFSMIESWKASRLSQKAFCREHDIRYFVFHYWYKVYRDHNGEVIAKAPAFIPLHIQRPVSSAAVLELVLIDGKRILFHQEPSIDFLKGLL